MLKPVKANAARKPGLNTVIKDGELDLLSLDLLILGKGEKFTIETGEREIAVVPLMGAFKVEAEGGAYELSRKDVFSEKASSLCLPMGTSAVVSASQYSEIALCKAKTSQKGRVVFIPKEGVREKTVGKDGWKRKVVDIITTDTEATRLVLGETFNGPAGWSSFPPHKHDTVIPGSEAKMEEIYLFRINPGEGFGTQTVYGEQGSFSFRVEDFDAVTIPWGYHPVSAMPGYDLYYLWFLAGEGRELKPNTDPKYRWLEEK